MVGYSEELRCMKRQVAEAVRPDDSGIMSIVGVKGSGRSYYARRIFEDVGKDRGQSYDLGVWAPTIDVRISSCVFSLKY
ncbi:hypothetical protein C2S52_021053 [Perilla frutescens var. hirtella]|nr:hypothetical protein C2S52_021053 [Perilla frutescens var. hirtella]KAH6799717.1 hypothetical protein C2S51_036201 [Perilla frutescens var. frutescens]